MARGAVAYSYPRSLAETAPIPTPPTKAPGSPAALVVPPYLGALPVHGDNPSWPKRSYPIMKERAALFFPRDYLREDPKNRVVVSWALELAEQGGHWSSGQTWIISIIRGPVRPIASKAAIVLGGSQESAGQAPGTCVTTDRPHKIGKLGQFAGWSRRRVSTRTRTPCLALWGIFPGCDKSAAENARTHERPPNTPSLPRRWRTGWSQAGNSISGRLLDGDHANKNAGESAREKHVNRTFLMPIRGQTMAILGRFRP